MYWYGTTYRNTLKWNNKVQNSLYRITPLKKKKEKTYTHAFACIEGEHVEDRDIETGAGGGPWGGILGEREGRETSRLWMFWILNHVKYYLFQNKQKKINDVSSTPSTGAKSLQKNSDSYDDDDDELLRIWAGSTIDGKVNTNPKSQLLGRRVLGSDRPRSNPASAPHQLHDLEQAT